MPQVTPVAGAERICCCGALAVGAWKDLEVALRETDRVNARSFRSLP
jgi:hypothetical protein